VSVTRVPSVSTAITPVLVDGPMRQFTPRPPVLLTMPLPHADGEEVAVAIVVGVTGAFVAVVVGVRVIAAVAVDVAVAPTVGVRVGVTLMVGVRVGVVVAVGCGVGVFCVALM